MKNDKQIFNAVHNARMHCYKAYKEVLNKDEIFFTKSQYKMINRFTSEIKNMSIYLQKIFSKGFET